MSVPPVDFKLLFQCLPGNYLVLLPDAPKFTIVAFNQKRAAETFTREDHIGKGLFEVFPGNPADPRANGVLNLTQSLEWVIREKKPHRMTVQKYDILSADGRTFEERYWLPENIPVPGSNGQLAYLLHTVVDVTETVNAEDRETATRGNFHAFFNQSQSPFAIFMGEELRVSFFNPAFAQLFTGRIKAGSALLEALPELRKQPFYNFLLKVLDTGFPYLGLEVPVQAFFGNDKEGVTTRYFNLNYTPYKNSIGVTEGILATATDVTNNVTARFQIY
jgi:PAS domain-containing protein